LQMVGDVAAGLNIPIGDMAYLFGQMQSQGRAMTQDLNQFAARGVPIYRTLAEILNTNVAGVRRMAEQGQISFPLIQQAFERMTRSGGQFAGMMEAQSQTLAGRWSTFKDLVHEISIEFGNQLNPALKQSLEILTDMLGSDPGQSTFFTQMGATIGATINEINMLVQGLRILFAYYRSAEEEEIARLTARFDELSALQERYDVIQSGGDLIVTFPQTHPGMEFQENVAGNMTGFYRNVGETAWRRIEAGSELAAGLNIPQNQNPGGSPGGVIPGPNAIQLASEAADAAMAEYEAQQNAYKTLLIAKAEADLEANNAQIKAQKEHWEGMLNIAQTAMSGIMELHSMASNMEIQKIENDYNQKKKWIKENVKDEKERAKQLEKLEEEKEKKIAAVKAKYAKEQKALMLMNAIVQTAAGITSALAMSGPPWVAIAMAAIVGAIGAAQIGLIAATPVPQAQYGGSFTVPPGYEADSGLLRVNSGERVDVTPERFSGEENRDINISIDGESMRGYISREVNRAVNNGSVQIRRRSAVRVS
jgi:tape measure domain-containing protein